ncbi:MAG: ECF transporter S component [Acutalibacteraceae bacterium]
MKKTISAKNLAFCALCIALCVVLPMAFHAIANAGPIFLPMHIPVLLCGLACGWPYGLVCGVLGPVLSGVLTGMPAPAVLPGMMVECGVYGLVSGLMMQLVHTKKAVRRPVYQPDHGDAAGTDPVRRVQGAALRARDVYGRGVGNDFVRDRPARHRHPACAAADACRRADEGAAAARCGTHKERPRWNSRLSSTF